MIRRVGVLLLVLAAAGLWAGNASAASPCPDSMVCKTVKVPLDWTGKQKGTLQLPVRVGKGDAPVLLFLAGGPGQGFIDYGPSIQSAFSNYLKVNYRVAVLDQRGTGATAIDCRPLQSLNLTDLTVRPRKVVRSCGNQLGKRRAFYSTASTVLDLDAVRKALGVKKMAIMGTSYGTYVAEHYARRFPTHVSRLILDSVVPQENIDPLLRVHMKRTGYVLRKICANGACGFNTDPAKDLARLVAKPPRRGTVPVPGKEDLKLTVKGATLIDWLTTFSSFLPQSMPGAALAIHQAARGNYKGVFTLGYSARSFAGYAKASQLSWGLHAATLCSDLELPYSIASPSRASRLAAVNRGLARLPGKSFYPFDKATARGNGVTQVCLDWPATKVKAPPKPGPINVPELILAGQYDLSTPLAYAKRELKRAKRGSLIVVPKAGHSVALRGSCADLGIRKFLRGQPVGNPCKGAEAQSLRARSWTMPAAAR